MAKSEIKGLIKTVLKWGFGLAFFYLAIGWSIKGGIGIIGGILFLIAGLICIPPTLSFLEVKLGGRMSAALKYMIVIGSFILALFLLVKFGTDMRKTSPVQTQSSN